MIVTLMSFAEFMSSAEGVISLITAALGLIGTAVGAFFAIKGWIKAFREKDAKEKWGLIMQVADAAMKEAEKTGKSGADKKALVIETVKAGCEAAGIPMDGFLDQLSDYIDQTISFVNGMTK